MNEFFRDEQGKISATKLSSYGQQQINLMQGAKLYFSDGSLTVKGNALVNDAGKVVQNINNDRLVNKIIYKII